MSMLLNSPGLLLAVTGALLGLNFPIGKLASQAGVPASVWAAWIAVSVSVVLGTTLLLQRERLPRDAPHRRYYAVTALVSYALPNLLVLAAMPRLGSGLTSLFFTLSPIVTVLLSSVAGLRRPQPLELVGIAVGLGGALLVVSGRGEVGRPADWAWLAAAMLIPVSLACGNVFRTVAWPAGSHPLALAVGSNLAAAVMLLALAFLASDSLASLQAVPGLMALQAAASSAMFLFFFRLQQVGGPVTLSQIGTVAAAVGIGVGAGLMGERYAAVVWTGVLVIVIGLALTLAARLRPEPPA